MLTLKRRLTAILFADIQGYTAMMQKSEAHALGILRRYQDALSSLTQQYNGEIVKNYGDGSICLFKSASESVLCAIDLQEELRKEPKVPLRIGLHEGDVVFSDNDVYGNAINIASRIESMGVAGNILLSNTLAQKVKNQDRIKLQSLGSFNFKNIEDSIEVYAIKNEGFVIPDKKKLKGKFEEKRFIMSNSFFAALGVLALILLIFLLGKQLIPENPKYDVIEAPAFEMISLAALPFSNISRDAEIDFLGFAMVDQVISSLSYLQNIVIRPSSSIRKYNKEMADPHEVAKELSVQYILTGTYGKNADSVRFNLQLIDIRGNKVLWTVSVQEEMKDIFKLQDVVAQKVIDGLEIEFLQDERKRMVKDAPDDPLAYEYYLKSLSAPYSVAGNELAIGLLRKSIDLDSTYAPTFAELGNRLHLKSNFTIMDKRSTEIQKAINYLEKALQINEESLISLSYLSMMNTEINELEKAHTISRRILEINPNSAVGHFALGYIYRYTGMINEAATEMAKAVSIDPKTIKFRSIITTYSMVGRYEEALEFQYYNDGSGFSESWRGITYIRMDSFDQARHEFRKVLEIDSESTLGKWCGLMLSYVNGKIWNDEMKRETLAIEHTIEDPESIYYWSLINIMNQDYDGFLSLYEKAIDLGYYPYPAFQFDPILNPMRENIEFQRITQKAKRKHEEFKKRHF